MPGVPKPVYILLTPIEIATYLIVRPLTISLRLFANMFAGHLLLMIFYLGWRTSTSRCHWIKAG
jgi:F-type H+-transporting ATPase subunit a